MILALDVDYRDSGAITSGITFNNWQDTTETQIYTSHLKQVAEYQPGAFYKRELPCLTQQITELITEHKRTPSMIVIDGFVWLDGHSKAGLGAYLFDFYQQKIPIIGVAKNAYNNIDAQYQLLRGKSSKPLYITSAGIPASQAIEYIREMHGKHRIPTLLKKADTVCRTYFNNLS